MKSACMVVTQSGGPGVLQPRAREETPAAGEVLVRVEGAGVSYGDVLARAGVIPGGPKPPYVPGFDVTGRVIECGAEVEDLQLGDRVVALVRQGAYSDVVAVDADRAVLLPQGLDPVVCAAGILNTFIAWQMLHRVAKIQAGQRILVHGASGGVGLAMVQIARMHGVEVWGTCSTTTTERVLQAGATPIDYTPNDFGQVVAALDPPGVNAVFDHLGGTHFLRSYNTLRSPGILVAYGQDRALRNGKKFPPAGIVGFLGGIALPKLIPDGRRTTFYNAWSLESSDPEAYRIDMATALRLLAERRVRPVIADVVELADAAGAHRRMESRNVHGKLVLVPGAGV